MASRRSFRDGGKPSADSGGEESIPDAISSSSPGRNRAKSDSEDAPFVPLEETMNGQHQHHGNGENGKLSPTATPPKGKQQQQQRDRRDSFHPPSPPTLSPLPVVVPKLLRNIQLDAKKVVSSCMFTLIFLLIWDSLFTEPENRILRPDFSQHFLQWVQQHPAQGLLWILLFMASAVVFMIPIGTPITVGCGYIYKGAYGWKLGVLLATAVSMAGSALGAVVCFLLGRYLMRDLVRHKWIRKYPLFDAIDVAAAEHGLRIMAMLYLTPILPLGPVSYMCGTTSMALHHFVLAKVAALPLMMLYVFIGASTGTLIQKGKNGNAGETMSAEQVQQIEENQTLMIGGIVLSFVSIACITHYIKKELNKILERQKREKHSGDGEGGGGEEKHSSSGVGDVEDAAATVELGKTASAPRQRKH